jgi:hypothetical protein
MKIKHEDKSMERVHALFRAAKMSLHGLGLKMGYDAKTARQSAFQFMKSGDPRMSMLRKFAKAMGISVDELMDEKNDN